MGAKEIIENYDGGSIDLSGCDLTGVTLPDELKSKVIL